MIKKRKTIDDWKNVASWAAKELSGQARSDKEITKSLRDNLSSAFNKRPTKIEIDKLRGLMEAAGVIKKLSKGPVRIGQWTESTDVDFYEIVPERVQKIGEKVQETKQKTETAPTTASTKKTLKFRMLIQKGQMTVGELWHNGLILKSFKTFSIIQFVLNQETSEDSKRFVEAIEELRDLKIDYGFDLKTNPGVIKVVERLLAL